jgi:hypothetical protein
MFPLNQSQEELLQKRLHKDQRLLDAIKNKRLELEDLRSQFTLIYEDGLYRFYHGSFKVYSLQTTTLRAVAIFKSIAEATDNNLCGSFNPCEWHWSRIRDGTQCGLAAAYSPFVEAFLHTKYFLEMMIKYGKGMESAQAMLPDGWAAIFELYNQR